MELEDVTRQIREKCRIRLEIGSSAKREATPTKVTSRPVQVSLRQNSPHVGLFLVLVILSFLNGNSLLRVLRTYVYVIITRLTILLMKRARPC